MLRNCIRGLAGNQLIGVNRDGLECKDGKWCLIRKGSEQEAVHNDSEVCLQCGAAEAQPRERQT